MMMAANIFGFLLQDSDLAAIVNPLFSAEEYRWAS